MFLPMYRVLAALLIAIMLTACIAESPQQVLNVAPSPQPVTTLGPSAKIPLKIGELRDIPFTQEATMRRALERLAGAQGFETVKNPRSPFTYTFQGHFSALALNGAATIIQSWSVYDATGKLSHEFVLSTPQSGVESFPWTAVSDATIDAMATDALSRLSAWHRRAK